MLEHANVHANWLRMRKYLLATAVAWTVCVLLSFAYSIQIDIAGIRHIAKAQARSELYGHVSILDELMQQHVSAGTNDGGFGRIPLDHPGPETEIMHPVSAVLLPEDAATIMSTNVRIVGLYARREKNLPDPWERDALALLVDGREKKFEFVQSSDGSNSARLIVALRIREDCMACHSEYEGHDGDLAGGASLTLPMTQFEEYLAADRKSTEIAHLSVYGVGLLGIGFAARRLRRSVRKESEAEADLRQNRQFLQAVLRSMGDEVRVIDRDFRLRFSNRSDQSPDFPITDSGGPVFCYKAFQGCEEPCPTLGRSCIFMEVVEARASVRKEITETDNGKLRHIEISASPIWDDDGNTTSVVEVIRDTTERRQNEEALRLSEERLDLALNGAQLATWDSNLDTRTVYISERGAAMLGFTPAELPQNIEEFSSWLHPDDLQTAFSTFASHVSGESQIFELEARVRHRSGNWVWTLNRGRIVNDGDRPEGIRFCGTSLDISERKRAEQLLLARVRISEFSHNHTYDELLQCILDEAEALTQSSIGFLHWVNEDHGTLLLQMWSTNTVAHMCTAEGKGLHYPIADAGVWADAVRFREPIIHNDYESLSHRKGLPSGHAQVHRELVVPVKRAGKVVALLGVGNKPADYTDADMNITTELANMAWDIVGAKQANEQRSLTEARFRLVMETSGEAIYILDETGILLECNDAFTRAIGYSRDEVVGKHASLWNAQWDYAELTRRAINHKEINDSFETRHRRRDGSVRDVEVSVSCFHEGTAKLLCCTARDITQRKQNELTKTTINRILTILQIADGSAMYHGVLDVLREITESAFGIFGYIDQAGDWICPALTREIVQIPSEAIGDPVVFRRDSWIGPWGRALTEKTTQVGGGGYIVPEGHVEIESVIAVPLLHDDILIGLFALANKPGGYTSSERELLEIIGTRISPVLHARIERDRERQRREDAIRALTTSENRYHSLFNEMLSGFAVHEILTDAAGHPIDYSFREVNAAWERMTGITAEMAIGRTVREVLPNTEEYWIERYGRVALTGTPEQFVSYSDALNKYFEVRAYSPAPRCFATVIHDVTDRVAAQDELKQSAERLRQITQNMPVMMDAFDENGVIVAWNLECERVTGYTAEEIIGNPNAIVLLYPDESYRERVQLIWQNLSTDRTDGEVTIRCKNGTERTVIWSNVSRRYPIPGWNSWAIGIDVTERNQAQKELIQLAAAIEQAGESVVIISIDGRVRYANPAFLATSGYGRDEVIGQFFTHVTLGSANHEALREIRARISAGSSWRGRVMNRRKDGACYTAEAALSAVLDTNGHPVSLVGVGRDITHEMELETQLLQAQKMETVGQLAGGIAHDFNNLLQIINGYADIAVAELESGSPAYDMVKEIAQAGTRAAGLVRQLLAFSRRQVMNPESIDLNDVIAGWLKSLGRVIGEHIRLTFSPGPDLSCIRADRGMIDQVLMNLCVNARDAMTDGGILSISTENCILDESFCVSHPYTATGPYVLVRVADTGCGMDDTTLEHIFEPFFTTKGPGEGTGLGLATVYGIVKQHDGILDVSSTRGHGTEFRIYLPAIDSPTSEHHEEAVEKSDPLRGTVLLAEDDEQVRRLALGILQRAGLTVLEAADGADAIAVFEANAAEIDVLIFDVVMPRVGGRQAYDYIRGLGYETPIIFASGYNENAIHTGFVLERGYRLVQKPFKTKTLLDMLRQVLAP